MTEPGFFHTVLIVDDEEKIGRAIRRLLNMNDIESVYADSAPKALDQMASSETPFSLILSDQRMPDMPGTEFLEQARKIHPHTIRFLVTGYSDMETIVNSINKGAVHRYILKPWDDDMFMDTVRSGLKRYEEMLENERLTRTVKKQHKKLHQLKEQLITLTSDQYRKIVDMDREIEDIREQLEELKAGMSTSACHPDKVITHMESILLKENDDNINMEDMDMNIKDMNMDMDNINRLHRFYTCCIRSTYEEFDGISKRNGFEMPRIMPAQSLNSGSGGT